MGIHFVMDEYNVYKYRILVITLLFTLQMMKAMSKNTVFWYNICIHVMGTMNYNMSIHIAIDEYSVYKYRILVIT